MTVIRVVARDIREHDAVGRFALHTARRLNELGARAVCYAENTVFPDSLVRPIQRLGVDLAPEDQILFHFSTFDPVLEEILSYPLRKHCYVHNITDPAYFREWNPSEYGNVLLGYGQFRLLSGFDSLAANSMFTAHVVKEHVTSEPKTEIELVPPIPDIRSWKNITSQQPAISLNPAEPLLLFVGRRAPNKNISRLLRVVARLQERQPQFNLAFVGRAVVEAYEEDIRSTIASSGSAKQKWHVFNEVSDAELRWLYERAYAFLTFSTHEGFCIPVADAFYFDLPVYGYAQPAVNELCVRAGGNYRLTEQDDDGLVAQDLDTFLKHHAETEKEPFTNNIPRRVEEYCNGDRVDRWLSGIMSMQEKRTVD